MVAAAVAVVCAGVVAVVLTGTLTPAPAPA
ncbi:murein L,D-transpeptidase, partial [Curtobacterium sp. MCBD17_008]